MSDITIPAHEAKNLADYLRRHGIGEHHPIIALLDPPAPSLRDEIADWLADQTGYNTTSLMDQDAASAILAAVRRRIGALPTVLHTARPTAMLDRDDVMRLLGGGDE